MNERFLESVLKRVTFTETAYVGCRRHVGHGAHKGRRCLSAALTPVLTPLVKPSTPR